MVVITTLRKIGIDAVTKEWRNTTKSVIESLGRIYIKALENDALLNSDIGRYVRLAIHDIVEVSERRKLEFRQEYMAEPIKNICLVAIKKAESKPNFQDLMSRIEYDLILSIINIGNKNLESEKESLPPFWTINTLRLLIAIGFEIEKIEINKRGDGSISISASMRKNIISMFNFAFKNEQKDLLLGGLIIPIGNVGLEISSKHTKYGFYPEPQDIKNLSPKCKNELEIEYKWIICLLGEIGMEVNRRIKSESIMIKMELEEAVGDFIIRLGDKCITEDILHAAKYASKILKELEINHLVKSTLDEHPKFKAIHVSEL